MKRILFLLCAFAVSSAWAATPSSRIKVVEYIESSGTQWINTGFSPVNKNVRFEMTYRFVSLPADGSRKYVFGSCQSDQYGNNIRFQYAVGSEGNCAFGFGDGWINNATVNSYDTSTVHTIVCDGGVFSLDGVVVQDQSSAPFKTPGTTDPVYWFANNNKGSVSPSYSPSMRLYSCRIWANGVLVRDFMPAFKGETTPCLYDAVGGAFYENAGSGSFTAGDVVREISLSYSVAFYIEANRTAYIDTQYVPNSKTELEMDFAFTEELNAKTYVFGVYGNDGGRLMFSYGPAATGCFLGYGNTYQSDVPGIPYNTSRHVVKYVPGEGFYFDGNLVTTATVDLTEWTGTSKNLFLGTCNRNGGDVNTAHNAPIRIYSCKIWEDGILVRDMVPRQRIFDEKNGLYDTVTGKFYTSYGNGADFTARLAPKNTLILLR